METTQSDGATLQLRNSTRKGTVRGTSVARRVPSPNGNGAQDKVPKTEVEFKVTADRAQAVAIAGTFNHWNPKETQLMRSGDSWTVKLALPRGRYEYRFVVDGDWIADPNATESVPNPFGGSNSILSV